MSVNPTAFVRDWKCGTIMHHSNIPFLVWYRAIFLMSTTKKGFSAKQMQRHLRLKRYEPVWAMVDKLRKGMGNREAKYTLEAMIEGRKYALRIWARTRVATGTLLESTGIGKSMIQQKFTQH